MYQGAAATLELNLAGSYLDLQAGFGHCCVVLCISGQLDLQHPLQSSGGIHANILEAPEYKMLLENQSYFSFLLITTAQLRLCCWYY